MNDELLESKKLISLSSFFGFEYSISDPHDTLKKVFKKVKEHIRALLDLEDDSTPVAEKLDMSNIELGSPIEEVSRDVLKRVNFLFEVIPSTNYQAEVTKIVTKTAKQTFFKNKRMVDIIEEIEEDQLSEQKLGRERSEISEQIEENKDDDGEVFSQDSDSEELLPEGP